MLLEGKGPVDLGADRSNTLPFSDDRVADLSPLRRGRRRRFFQRARGLLQVQTAQTGPGLGTGFATPQTRRRWHFSRQAVAAGKRAQVTRWLTQLPKKCSWVLTPELSRLA